MITLEVPDMACGGCVDSVTKAVQKIDSRAVVEADIETKTVTIESDVAPQMLLKALEEAGFTAIALHWSP